MKAGIAHLKSSQAALAAVALLVLTFLFWKFRIFDSGVNPAIELGPMDMYLQYLPMVQYGYERLASGEIALWNPYQFCGEPHLAIPYSSLFYPPHFFFLFVDKLLSVEISFLLHMFFGGACMWMLARRLHIAHVGACCAAITFMWSGWMISYNSMPLGFACMTWLPLTILLLDGILRGDRLAGVGLIAALVCQLLLGITEIVVHTLYVGAFFTLCRLVQMVRGGERVVLLQRASLILVCILAAVLIAMPQLLPSFELAQQSARASGSLSFGQAAWGSIAPRTFLGQAVGGLGVATVGVVPLLGLPLVLGFRRHRFVWMFGLITASLSMLLVFGGPVYRLYFEIPVIGDLFRRPMKFLDIYAFGQALLVGLALTRLWDWTNLSRRALWLQPGWIAALAVSASAIFWRVSLDASYGYWLAASLLLLSYGLISHASLRRIIVIGVCVLQGASLFFKVGDTHVRPIQRPEIFSTHQPVLEHLKKRPDDGRIYISPAFFHQPGLMPKQGTLSELPVTTDYEPLLPSRYVDFIRQVIGSGRAFREPFVGDYYLSPHARWKLMDLTATRYFVTGPMEAAAAYMAQRPSIFREWQVEGYVRVFESTSALPRAYFVPSARVLSRPEDVLEALIEPSFNPRKQVLLEGPVKLALEPPPTSSGSNRVAIISYEPERVVIQASVSVPGFLVLSDLFYPGWRAFVGEREADILRANYLFRAVRLDPGISEIRFVFQPSSFRAGIVVSGLTMLLVAAALFWRRAAPPATRGSAVFSERAD